MDLIHYKNTWKNHRDSDLDSLEYDLNAENCVKIKIIIIINWNMNSKFENKKCPYIHIL